MDYLSSRQGIRFIKLFDYSLFTFLAFWWTQIITSNTSMISISNLNSAYICISIKCKSSLYCVTFIKFCLNIFYNFQLYFDLLS